MFKRKQQERVFSTTVTQTESGGWEWITGVYKWRWHDWVGVNLHVSDGGDYQPAIFAKNVDHAIMFSHGFEGGVKAGEQLERKRQAAETQRAINAYYGKGSDNAGD